MRTAIPDHPLDSSPPQASSSRLAGGWLSAVHKLSELPGADAVVRAVTTEVLGIRELVRLPDEFRGELPDDPRPLSAQAPRRWDEAGLSVPRTRGSSRSTRDYTEAYASGRTTPERVAEQALASMELFARRSPSMNVLAACDPDAVREAARAASARWARGDARPLEGIPFLVKDQHDVAGLPTRFGSGHNPVAAIADATVVARMRAAGAIVLGKSAMTEWGVSPIGTSVHVTLPRNPHAPTRGAGGSSTGSAVAVALGIGPFATGGDAGGSVRVPAALSGIFGIKPTFGRISRAGEAFSGSLNHLGALAVSTEDLARMLDIIASDPDPADPMTAWAPPPQGSFGARLGDGVRGLRIGIDEEELHDCDPEIAAAYRAALRALERDGATLVRVRIPLACHAAAIGVATIGCEGDALARTVSPELRACLALDVRLAMNVASGVSAGEFLDVQRLRVGLRRQLAAALQSVDVLALPTVPTTAPLLSDREMTGSFSDSALVLSLCRYAFLANLTGVPAATAPIGVDSHGVPIGLQIIGDAWDEAGVLAVLAHLERAGIASVPRATGAVDLLATEERASRVELASEAESPARAEEPTRRPEWDVIVVGGGFSGVHCATEIERRMPEARVLLLEASDRLGGRARSFLPPGSDCALDLGAHYLGIAHVRSMALARRLLHKDQIYSNVDMYSPDPASRTYLEGRFRTTTKKTSYLELQGLSRDVGWDHRVRIFESLTEYLALEATVDQREPWNTPNAASLDRITAREWIDAQRVPRWIKEMWGIAMLDIISIRPEQVSMLYWLWYNAANGGFLKVANDHRGGPQEFSLTVGLEGLLARHAAEIRGRVALSTPVTAVLHDRADRVTVLTADGGRFQARRVVVAVTPRAAGQHLRFEPELSASRRLLHAQPLGHAVKAVLVYDTPWWRQGSGPHFMGYTAGAHAEGVEWALDTSHPTGRQYSLSAFVSERLIDRAGSDEAARRRLICESMEDLCGDARAGRPAHVEIYDWRSQPWIGGGPNTSFGPGVLSRVGDVFNQPEGPHHRLYFASAEYATVFPGYVEGALASAELNAERICWDLAGELGRPRAATLAAPPGDGPARLRSGVAKAARTILTPAVLAADLIRSMRGREPRLS